MPDEKGPMPAAPTPVSHLTQSDAIFNRGHLVADPYHPLAVVNPRARILAASSVGVGSVPNSVIKYPGRIPSYTIKPATRYAKNCSTPLPPARPICDTYQMNIKTRALSVHLLTATGAVFAMLAMLAAVDAKWDLMFLWLVVAFFVDGIDGPLARKFDVKTNAPEFDGVLLDLIIDYLTYVFIPAFALFKSGLMDGWSGWVMIIIVTFASAMYFADTRMKTKDNSFSGFPGCFNMLVLVLFALSPVWWVCLIFVTVLSIAMFVPVKFVHPVRTERWRTVTLPMALAWTFFAGWAAWVDFHPESWAHWGLMITSLYLVGAGAAQQLLPRDGD